MKTKKRLGEILIEAGIISVQQLTSALKMQKKWNEKLGITMVKLGFFDDNFLLEVLSEQLSIEKAPSDLLDINKDILGSFPLDIIYKNKVVPFKQDEKKIFIITNDPTNKKLFKEISSITNKEVKLKLATQNAIKNLIDKIIIEHSPSRIDLKQDSRYYVSYGPLSNKLDIKKIGEESLFRYGASIRESFLTLFKKISNEQISKNAPLLTKKLNHLKKLLYDKKVIKKKDLEKIKSHSYVSVSSETIEQEFKEFVNLLIEKNIITQGEYFKKIVLN